MKKYGEYAVLVIYIILFWAGSIAEPEMRRMSHLPADGYISLKVHLYTTIALLVINIVLSRSKNIRIRLLIPGCVFVFLWVVTIWLLFGASYLVAFLIMASSIPSGSTIFDEIKFYRRKTNESLVKNN